MARYFVSLTKAKDSEYSPATEDWNVRTIDDWMTQFQALYGTRNEEQFRRSLLRRIAFLHRGFRKLSQVIRKREEAEKRELLPTALARVVGYLIAVVQHYTSLPLTKTLVRKFCQGKCAYCGKPECGCPKIGRHKVKLGRGVIKANELTIEQLAKLLDATYGNTNRERGLLWILQKLVEEIDELWELEEQIDCREVDLRTARRELALEAADVLAWIIALANYFQVDLEAALEARYGKGCWSCHTSPCSCPIPPRRSNRRKRRSR